MTGPPAHHRHHLAQPCPACTGPVLYPRDAGPGDHLICNGCALVVELDHRMAFRPASRNTYLDPRVEAFRHLTLAGIAARGASKAPA